MGRQVETHNQDSHGCSDAGNSVTVHLMAAVRNGTNAVTELRNSCTVTELELGQYRGRIRVGLRTQAKTLKSRFASKVEDIHSTRF